MGRHSSFHQHSQSRVILTRVGLLTLVAVLGYLVFEFGRIQANYNIVEAARERETVEAHIAKLNADIKALNEQIAMLETHRAVDKEAYREVESSLVSLQAKIQEQTDAIAFYRGIVSPADGAAGLRVQDFRLSRGGDERSYNLRLVLVQSLKHDRKVSGSVNIVVVGQQDGSETSYEYADLLAADNKETWPFSFRYFQDFDREILLPDGFTPHSIKVEVRSTTRSIASVEESYAWGNSLG